MKCSGAAPCQCHSPEGVWTTSPERMVVMGSPFFTEEVFKHLVEEGRLSPPAADSDRIS